MDFSVDQHREGDLAVISLQGSLTTEATDRLSACLDTTLPTTRSLVIDLSRTTALDEEGLSVLLDAERRARRRGDAVRAAGVHGAVEDVFEEFDAWRSLGGHHTLDEEVRRLHARDAARDYFRPSVPAGLNGDRHHHGARRPA